MSFISESDLYRGLRKQYIDEIKRDDETLPDECINAAIGEMKGYLQETFDTTTIFGKTGTERDPLLKAFAVDIAIYNILSLATPGADIEQKRLRYKRAIDWLTGVKNQSIITDLPLKEDSPAQNAILYGSVEKKETRY